LYVSTADLLFALTDTGPAPVELWRFEPPITPTAEAFATAATVGADGTVYIGSASGHVLAVSPPTTLTPTATLKWAFDTGPGDIRSMPALDLTGTLYVGSDDHRGVLWGLRDDGSTVTVVAQTTLSPTADPSSDLKYDLNSTPAIDVTRDTLYIGSDYGKLHAFKLPSLTPKWEVTAGVSIANDAATMTLGPEDSAPAIAPDGTVIIGSEDGSVYAVHPDGSRAWTQTPCGRNTLIGATATDTVEANHLDSSAAISANGLAYIGSYCGLFAYSVFDGSFRWSTTTINPVVEAAPAIGPDGSVFFAGDTATVETGTIVAAVTGTVAPAVF
jgi:outer membrane protein assembly factor BamB